jgi:hypothetical protein
MLVLSIAGYWCGDGGSQPDLLCGLFVFLACCLGYLLCPSLFLMLLSSQFLVFDTHLSGHVRLSDLKETLT